MIRVGKPGCKRNDFITIPVYSGQKTWNALSPYTARTSDNVIMENKWQFSKIYSYVNKSTQRYSRWNNTVIWEWPEERHIVYINGLMLYTKEYCNWRHHGYTNNYAVRYPVGKKDRHKCIGFLTQDGKLLDYISSRHEYIKMYIEAINTNIGKDKLGRSSVERLNTLILMVKSGINILITEPDGPDIHLLDHYINTYNLESNFIESDGTILINIYNMNIMFNDAIRPFGHGYVLGLYILSRLN